MAAQDRELSRDRDLGIRHYGSFSDSGRLSVPMWDSSDPDRAPPPLPLNPGSSGSITKSGTSQHVAAAAEQLASKTRQAQYTINSSPTKSAADRSPVKASNRLDSSLSQAQSNGRKSLVGGSRISDSALVADWATDFPLRSPDPSSQRQSPQRHTERQASPKSHDVHPLQTTPTFKGARRLDKQTGLENKGTPPPIMSVAKLQTPDEYSGVLLDTTNTTQYFSRHPHSFEAISSQILSLTSIATSLQKELANLSRRSKDNAADLNMLKDATKSRNDELHKSLKDLTTIMPVKSIDGYSDAGSVTAGLSNRPSSTYLESRPFNVDASLPRNSSFPRLSPSPGPMSSEITAVSRLASANDMNSVLLEKVWSDMATKGGIRDVMAILAEIKSSYSPSVIKSSAISQPQGDDLRSLLNDSPKILHTVQEILRRMRANNEKGQSLVVRSPTESPKSWSHHDIPPSRIVAQGTYTGNEELQGVLKKIKDSISDGGGMTAEVKAHVRELRGEVLGMGRNIARCLEEAVIRKSRHDSQNATSDEVTRIVASAMQDLKDHMEQLSDQLGRGASTNASSSSKSSDSSTLRAVQEALRELTEANRTVTLNRAAMEEISDVVRDTLSSSDLRQAGLERDEIEACLTERLQYFHSLHKDSDRSIRYEDVLTAVQEGFKILELPAQGASLERDDIIAAMQESLQSLDLGALLGLKNHALGLTKSDISEAISASFEALKGPQNEIRIDRDELSDAIQLGLKSVGSSTISGDQQQIAEKIDDLVDGMRIEFKQYSQSNGGDSEQILDAIKDGLEVLRSDIETYVDRAAVGPEKSRMVEAFERGLSQLREDMQNGLVLTSSKGNNQDFLALQEFMEREFGLLRQTMTNLVIQKDSGNMTREDLVQIFNDHSKGIQADDRDLNEHDELSRHAMTTMKDELSHLRETIANVLIKGSAGVNKDEVMEALREVLDAEGVRAPPKHDRAESILSNTSELMDAFNDGLDSIRSDMEKMLNKPVDMTVNYEILESLRSGMANIQSSCEELAKQQRLSHASTKKEEGVIVAEPNVDSLRRNDIGNLEVMITQLRMKVEALDNMPDPTPASTGANPENNVRFDAVETMLQKVQFSIDHIAKDRSDSPLKDDIQAFETLLRNTKAKIDEMASPDADGLARHTHIESLETLIQETRDYLEDAECHTVSKSDHELLQAMVKEASAGVTKIRDSLVEDQLNEKATKSDFEALQMLCMDTRAQISELDIPGPELVASKNDISSLQLSLDRMMDQNGEQHDMNGLAFEARKTEHAGIAEKIEDLKLILEDWRGELRDQMDRSREDVKNVGHTIDEVNENAASHANQHFDNVHKLIEDRFQAVHDGIGGQRDHLDCKYSDLLSTCERSKNDVVNVIGEQLESHFDAIMTKYDDAQSAATAKENAIAEKDKHRAELVNATKETADELRIMVDTLGTTVVDSCERMSEDSKTVFSRVEVIGGKLDDLLAEEAPQEHHLTRTEIGKVLSSIEGIQAHSKIYDPQILSAVKDTLVIVSQHLEQSKLSSEEIKSSVKAIPGAIPLPAIAAKVEDDSRALTLDQAALHEKLDTIIASKQDSSVPPVDLATLDSLREQISGSAAELQNLIVAAQTRAVDDANSKGKEAEEAAIALEKRIAQKAIVEADILRLSEQKEEIREQITSLHVERQDATREKAKVQADLTSLQTALSIRREELEAMETRAMSLERRMLDGILDHSRSLLATSRPASSLKEMNLKRVPSSTSSTSTFTQSSMRPGTDLSATQSAFSSGIGMALKRRHGSKNTSMLDHKGGRTDRRILSLSTLSGNRPRPVDNNMVLAKPGGVDDIKSRNAYLGPGNAKRSHSVRSGMPSRKISWTGQRSTEGASEATYNISSEDKENDDSILDEADEDNLSVSDAGTERRTSYSGTVLSSTETYDGGTGSLLSRNTSSYHDDPLASTVSTVGPRDLVPVSTVSHDSGSVMETADSLSQVDQTSVDEDQMSAKDDRSAAANVDEGNRSEEGESNQGELQNSNLYLAKQTYEVGDGSPHAVINRSNGEVILFAKDEESPSRRAYGHNSDSGIGTDIPTVNLDERQEYFGPR